MSKRNYCTCLDKECLCMRTACIRVIRDNKELWVCWNCIKVGDEVADDYGN